MERRGGRLQSTGGASTDDSFGRTRMGTQVDADARDSVRRSLRGIVG